MKQEKLNRIFTRIIVDKAFVKVLCYDMDYFDAKFTDHIVDKIVDEDIEDIKNVSNNSQFDFDYAKELINDYKTRVCPSALEAYGWTCENVEKAIVRSLPDEYKAALQKQFENDNEGEM